MASQLNLALGKGQLFTCSHCNLLAHDVNARHHLGHGVLHLHPGVHFNKVKLAVFVQKLKRARAAVLNFFARRHTACADFFNQLTRQARRRRLFNDFLVTPLHGAITLAQINRLAMLIGKHLDFDVPRIFKKLF